eukprot:NODE_12663_length_175_cov_9.761905_g12580_i0.p1 GENE.NODE_12663_length_175_cov_9.761905_g12580_i0~~NODE_12663_length_175_cov_9.761905_g12580_i0.p1  ORF type:complete len:56 (-),score=15.89 NODE_12663_length_175_cov_9.761905_g12580_i0:8-145(-)
MGRQMGGFDDWMDGWVEDMHFLNKSQKPKTCHPPPWVPHFCCALH